MLETTERVDLDAVDELVRVGGGVAALLIELGQSDSDLNAIGLQDGLVMMGSALFNATQACRKGRE